MPCSYVTVTQTEGAGFLVVTGSDATGLRPDPTTSNVNWWSDAQTLANLVLSTDLPSQVRTQMDELWTEIKLS